MDYFRPVAFLDRLSAHRWLVAVRHSLVLLLPVTFVGAMALLLGSAPVEAALSQVWGKGTEIVELAKRVGEASNGVLALFLAVLVSYSLATELRGRLVFDLSPSVACTVALINFLIYTTFSAPVVNQSVFGTHSILPAILIAIFSTEFLVLFLRLRYRRSVQRDYDLDPVLFAAIRAIVPALATVLLFLLVFRLISLVAFDLTQWLGASVSAVDEAFGNQLPGVLIVGVWNQLLWFVGIHGPHVLDNVYRAMFEARTNAGEAIEITRSLCSLYVHIGGSGSTLGLLIAVLVYVRKGDTRRVAKYALLPTLFNINELAIYGLPIVFNSAYLLPFLITPAILAVVSYAFVHFGLVPLDVTAVQWMTPPFLSGIINSGSWRGGALQLLCVVISFAVYAPFVRRAERRREAEGVVLLWRALVDIEAIKQQQRTVLDRHDQVGHTGRKLLEDFMRDLGTERVYLAYQPQHDQDGEVVGVEALLRWEHDQFGHIPPAVICALAEESRQIIPIGRWVIATACRQLSDWQWDGVSKLRMSVNLSPVQLTDESLVDLVRNSLQKHQLIAEEFGLEVTESQHVPHDAVSTRVLAELERLGVHLEMDDFGMGYSSMLYVRRFKFSVIKLDGSLTRDVVCEASCRDIIRSVVQLGRAMGIRVVAEYVETAEQQSVLESLGCDAFQGYLYSPALPAAACFEYLRDHGKVRAAPERSARVSVGEASPVVAEATS